MADNATTRVVLAIQPTTLVIPLEPEKLTGSYPDDTEIKVLTIFGPEGFGLDMGWLTKKELATGRPVKIDKIGMIWDITTKMVRIGRKTFEAAGDDVIELFTAVNAGYEQLREELGRE